VSARGAPEGRRAQCAAERLVVIVSGKPWDGVRGADRQLAEQLTRWSRVLWVDPPLSPATPAHYRPGVGRPVRPRLAAAAPGIVRLTPVVLPGLSRPGIRATTWPLVRAQLKWALRRLGMRPHAVVACSFDDVLGRWGDDVRNVLYGTDDWVSGAELMGLDPAWLRAEESRALAAADVVVAVTPELAARWAGLGARPLLVPNGCDPAAYADVDAVAPAAAAARLTGPVVGLVGRVSARIDIELLEAVADAGLSLLVVGPIEGEWERMRWPALVARPNVVHVDRVPFDELPAYFRAIDVGVTPYADTAFNRSSFPLKTLEYLAAGRAAVSTDLPATRWLAHGEPGVVGIAAPGPDGFVEAVRAAAALPRTGDLVRRRQTFAGRHSWARRAELFAAGIGLTDAPPADRGQSEVDTEPRYRGVPS
jgi:teichuronic acid biosynthesis glycosyltransferase TuaH